MVEILVIATVWSMNIFINHRRSIVFPKTTHHHYHRATQFEEHSRLIRINSAKFIKDILS